MQKKASGAAQAALVVVAVCLMFAVMQGIHDNYGVMMTGVMGTSGLGYDQVSFVIGVGALVYGFAQPVMGAIALRRSNAFVMLLGIALMVCGLVVTPLCRGFWPLLVFFGLVLPAGTCGLASGILMGAITPIIGEERAVIASGVLQASAGVGDMVMSPGLETLISGHGIAFALRVVAVVLVAAVPVVLWVQVAGRSTQDGAESAGEETGTVRYGGGSDAEKRGLLQILREAFRNRAYLLIVASFATCGFNMSIIESHLFSQYVSYGIEPATAARALSVYGVATMLGALATGALAARFSMSRVLGATYGARVFISLAFLLLPKSPAFAFVATAALGLTGDATVPPTMGIITKHFGARELAVLYGFALVGHQIGAFASASLGGVLVAGGMGYAPLWIVNLLLAAFASTYAFLIRDGRQG